MSQHCHLIITIIVNILAQMWILKILAQLRKTNRYDISSAQLQITNWSARLQRVNIQTFIIIVMMTLGILRQTQTTWRIRIHIHAVISHPCSQYTSVFHKTCFLAYFVCSNFSLSHNNDVKLYNLSSVHWNNMFLT